MFSPDFKAALRQFRSSRVTVLTGAGISAESGIPTFRGPEGYWTVGSKVYQPQEIATFAMFRQKPQEVWKWFLYRRKVCHTAPPNPGHLALVEMEQLFGDRFALVSQNVDGLHIRAGNSVERTYLIHGNLDDMRCSQECATQLYPIPNDIMLDSRESPLPDEMWQQLKCPRCHNLTRPHVLLWDEVYNEEYFRAQTTLDKVAETDLLIVVGTSGATTLPNHLVMLALQEGSTIIDINIEHNIFSEMAVRSQGGHFIQGPSGTVLPEIVKLFRDEE